MATRAAPPFDPSKSRFGRSVVAALGITHRDQSITVDAPGYPGVEIGLRPLNPIETALAHERALAWAKAHGFALTPEATERLRVALSAVDGSGTDDVVFGALAGELVEVSHAIGRETLIVACVVPAGDDKGKPFFESVEDLCHWFPNQADHDLLLARLRDHARDLAPGQRECTKEDAEEVVAAAKKGLKRMPSDDWPVSMLRGCIRILAAQQARSTGSTSSSSTPTSATKKTSAGSGSSTP